MKKTIFLILVFCHAVGILTAQNNKTITLFEQQKITGVDASSCWNIEISQGNSTQATITFPERFEKNIVFELNSDGTLKLAIRGGVNMNLDEKLTAVIVCSTLNKVDLSGACKLNGNGKLTADRIQLDLSGASEMSASVEASMIDIDLSGASGLTLTGKAEGVKIEVSGAAKGDMGELAMQKATVDLSGASRLSLNVSELIEGEISGASKLSYKGMATTCVDVSGASELKHK